MQSYNYDPYGTPMGADTRPAMLGAVLRAYNDAYICAYDREAYGSAAPKRQRIDYLYADEAERLADLRSLARRSGRKLWRIALPLTILALLAFSAGLFLAITDWPLLAWVLVAVFGANVGVFVVLLAAYFVGRAWAARDARRGTQRRQEEAWV